MITGIVVVSIFFLTAILALLERYLGKFKLPIYIFLGFILVVLAGTREIGLDPDSENYEYSYLNYNTSSQLAESIEFSYLWLSSIFNNFTHDVHALFLFYALFGLGLKFIAFRQLTEFWFLPVVVYLSYHYELHEMMQIRTGVLSGLFLMAVKYQADRQKVIAISLLALATFFHYSALVLTPMLFMSSDDMSVKKRLIWAALIPASYVIYFLGVGITMSMDIPLIGAKLASYQVGAEKGTAEASVNVFRPLHLFTMSIFFYLLYFFDTIKEQNKYFPLMMKLFVCSICSYTVLAFLPVLAQRVSLLYQTITILLYVNIYYTIRPKWAAILIVILISFVYLNYSMPLIGTHLFWKAE